MMRLTPLKNTNSNSIKNLMRTNKLPKAGLNIFKVRSYHVIHSFSRNFDVVIDIASLEVLCFIILVLYILNFLLGKRSNQRIAEDWLDCVR
jgi:hypothetical protein